MGVQRRVIVSSDELSTQFRSLYSQWEQAIHKKDWAWFERYFADDWMGTARPWPALTLNRDQLIAVDKQIESLDAQWIDVRAHMLGDSVITVAVARIGHEEFKPGGYLAEGVATTREFNDYCAGNTIAYSGAWRHNGENWQMFDHRLIGIIRGF
jgi:hypothetical protein